jgi:hypothetical protein
LDHRELLAFGFVSLGIPGQDGEWGYVDLVELEELRIPVIWRDVAITGDVVIERDCYWTPKAVKEIDGIVTGGR